MNDPVVNDHSTPERAPARRRGSPVRSMLLLALAVAALLAYIGATGYVRRKSNALAQAQRYAATLTQRMADTGMLPLNLEPPPLDAAESHTIPYEWVGRDDARRLRGHDGRIIAAETGPLPGMLRRSGRVVIFFDDGAFHVEWLPLDAFDRMFAEQESLLRGLRQESSPGD